MKKFSKKEIYNPKEFIVKATILLKIKSESSGEAGYLSDSILGSIESIENFKVIDIKENTDPNDNN